MLFSCGGGGNRGFLALLHGMWGLSSLTRIKPVLPPVEAQSPNHWTARKFPWSDHFAWSIVGLQGCVSFCRHKCF